MIKFSIVLPCYNEGETLQELVDSYRQAFQGAEGVELVLVDNGSSDQTAEQLKGQVSQQNPFEIKIVTIPVNIGYGNGILSGIEAASGEFLAWSHADLQCSPEDVLRLYQAVMARPDPRNCFGKGCRVNDRGRAIIFTKLQTWLSRVVLGYHFDEINAQPKLFHRDFLKEFICPPRNFALDFYAYYKALRKGMDIVSVDVVFHKRKVGKSRWAYSSFSRIRFIIKSVIYLFKLRLMRDKV